MGYKYSDEIYGHKSPREAGLEPLTYYQWKMLRMGFLLWAGIDFVIDLIDVRKEDFRLRTGS